MKLMARAIEKMGRKQTRKCIEGEIVYIHPKGRFITIKTLNGYTRSYRPQDITKRWEVKE